jgi:hypothetical protein
MTDMAIININGINIGVSNATIPMSMHRFTTR